MTGSHAFSEYYAELLQGPTTASIASYSTLFFLSGRLGVAYVPGGDDLTPDNGHLRDMAGTFSRRLRVPTRIEPQPVVLARHADERGLSKAHRPYPNALKSQRCKNHLRSSLHRPHQIAKRGRDRTEIFKAVQAHGYDLTVFKIKWGNLTLKIYDKGGRVLRIEVVVHNAKELRSGRMLERFPALLQRMRDILLRFLAAIQAAHVSFLDIACFESLTEPTTRGIRRLAGIDLNKARNRSRG
jgi:hypothetical protein